MAGAVVPAGHWSDVVLLLSLFLFLERQKVLLFQFGGSDLKKKMTNEEVELMMMMKKKDQMKKTKKKLKKD